MPFKIVRNDITQMTTDAIVNTANKYPVVGPGCDSAVYKAAGYDKLLAYRKAHIGESAEGEAFITPGFNLKAKYIIHAVSPLFKDGGQDEERKLRSCYRNSLAIAAKEGLKSIAFPLISTGSFGYPKEEGMRIAIDEIYAFLLTHDLMIYLVVFGEKTTAMGRHIDPKLEAYIDQNYVSEKEEEEYGKKWRGSRRRADRENREIVLSESVDFDSTEFDWTEREKAESKRAEHEKAESKRAEHEKAESKRAEHEIAESKRAEYKRAERQRTDHVSTADMKPPKFPGKNASVFTLESLSAPTLGKAKSIDEEDAEIEELERKLALRMEHLSDTFQEYLFFLISQKGLKNADVYKGAIVDKKVFSKIKNNRDYHPQKNTALRLCIGARLNLDETTDLLQRAGYALSPCDKTDVIFKFFIENERYDIIDLDIILEEYGQPNIIVS